MDNQQQKLRKAELKSLGTVKTSQPQRSSKIIVSGSIIGTVIAITPFLFTLYEYVPDQKVWNTFLFTYDSTYYESVYVVAWTLSTKLMPLLLLLIWFFTNRHWWYHALLVPIAMYLYHIVIIFNDDLKFVDSEQQVLYLLPIMAIIVPSIYLIRAKMFNKINDADKTLEELEEEFMIKPKTLWGKISQYF